MLYQAHITLSGDGSAAEFGKGVAYGRSRIKQLRALGKSYATENAKFGDVTVRMKLAGQQSFIHVDVAALGGYIVRPTSQVNPNGVTQSTPPTVPPTYLIPQAVISKLAKGDGASLKLKIKEHSSPYGTDSAAHLKTVDWRSTDGKTIIAFAGGDRYGRLDTWPPPWEGVSFASKPTPDYPFFADVGGYAYINGKKLAQTQLVGVLGIAKKNGWFLYVKFRDSAFKIVDFFALNGGNQTLIGSFSVASNEKLPYLWHFNGDGNKCVSVATKIDTAEYSPILISNQKPKEQFRMILAEFTFPDDDVPQVNCSFSGGWQSAVVEDNAPSPNQSGTSENYPAIDGRSPLKSFSKSSVLPYYKRAYRFCFGADFVDGVPSLLTVEIEFWRESTYNESFNAVHQTHTIPERKGYTIVLDNSYSNPPYTITAELTEYEVGDGPPPSPVPRSKSSSIFSNSKLNVYFFIKHNGIEFLRSKVETETTYTLTSSYSCGFVEVRYETKTTYVYSRHWAYNDPPIEIIREYEYQQLPTSFGASFSKNSEEPIDFEIDVVAIESIDMRNKSFVGTRFVSSGTLSTSVSNNFTYSGGTFPPGTITRNPPIKSDVFAIAQIGNDKHEVKVGESPDVDLRNFLNVSDSGPNIWHYYYGRPFFQRPTFTERSGYYEELHYGHHNWRKDSAIFTGKSQRAISYFQRDNDNMTKYQPHFFTNTSASKDSAVIAALKDAQTGNYTFKDVKDQFSIGGESKFEIRPILVY